MKNLIRDSLKITTGYLLALVVFGIFLIVVIGMAKNNFYFWLPVYSFLIFLLLVSIVYPDIKRLAIKDKKPQYNLNPYPLKGLVIGIIGFIPYIVLELIYPLLNFQDPVLKRIAHASLNTVMGPMYFIIRLGRGTIASYAAASLAVPVISMLAYMAGYYGIEPGKYFGRKAKEAPKAPSGAQKK